MSSVKNEVITKLRNDIRKKLDEIGAFVDNELADYIMVLVANQKSKYQMKDDLSLFLGAATDEFVNWLHTSLKQIQMSATQSEDKKIASIDKKEPKELSKKSNLSSIKSKSKHKKPHKTSDKDEEKPDSSEKIGELPKDENKSETTDQNPEVVAISTQPKTDSKESASKRVSIDKQADETAENQNGSEAKELNEGEVVLRLNPDGSDVDELLQENVNEEAKKRDKEERQNKKAKIVPLKGEQTKTEISSPMKKQKLIKESEEEEEINDPNRPVVASVVRVTKRKSSVPMEMYANKKLLLKAVKDANDSTQGKRKRHSDEIEYTPTPIKKRLGERQEITDGIDQLDPQDLRNYLKVNKKDSDRNKDPEDSIKRKVRQKIVYTEAESSTESIDPQFVVTLNGIDHKKFLKDSQFEDRIIFDEDMDEELLVEPEYSFESENMENDDLVVNKINERCRFWPSCKNGDDCEFLHPNAPCKAFPNCRFGDKCLYIHPNCKFDAMCSRRDCPFTHASRRKIPTSAAIISSLLPPSSVKQCKYLPNCKNPACPYFHPKLCRFGDKCRHPKCLFFHPYVSYSAQPSVAHPHQLKWRAKDHISERQFSREVNIVSTGAPMAPTQS